MTDVVVAACRFGNCRRDALPHGYCGPTHQDLDAAYARERAENKRKRKHKPAGASWNAKLKEALNRPHREPLDGITIRTCGMCVWAGRRRPGAGCGCPNQDLAKFLALEVEGGDLDGINGPYGR